MQNPKKASDDYIQLKKKITDKEIRNIVAIIARDRDISRGEVCYDFIKAQANIEINKRKNNQ